jgi:CarD family transcriptional regulator
MLMPNSLAVLGSTFGGVPADHDNDDEPLDWTGGVLATLGLGGLTWALTVGSGDAGWTPSAIPARTRRVPAPAIRTKPEAEAAAIASQKATQRQGFKSGEFIVYPAHGVGQIVGIEEQEVAGAALELFVINFVKDKMTLRVPIAKIVSVGIRKLAEGPLVKRALETLKGRARINRTMWSRRAQEYEAKINSGDIVLMAEVVRDLYRSESQPEQSYSERQLYEAALDRLSREIAAVRHITETEAVKEIEGALAKAGPKPADEGGVDDEAA